jgi:hypothetical protein
MSKERAAKVMQEIFSKGTYEGDLLGINEGGKMSDTPRTDFVAHESGDPEWNRSINRFGRMQSHAQILERELAEARKDAERYRYIRSIWGLPDEKFNDEIDAAMKGCGK